MKDAQEKCCAVSGAVIMEAWGRACAGIFFPGRCFAMKKCNSFALSAVLTRNVRQASVSNGQYMLTVHNVNGQGVPDTDEVSLPAPTPGGRDC